MNMRAISTKDRFDETLNRCNSLVELFEKEANDDLLRAAIVLAVAALDKYCKDKFLDFFEEFYRQTLQSPRKRLFCDSYLDDAGVGVSARLALYQEKSIDDSFSPEREMSKRLRAYLYRSTFQSHEAITELFQCFGLDGIIDNAVKKAGEPEAWTFVERLIRRRHSIAHTADCNAEYGVLPLNVKMVVGWLKTLEELVGRIDSIVDNRFKVATEEQRQSPQTVLTLADRPAEEFTAAYQAEKGYLDAKELSSLRRISDIEDLFKVRAKRRGFLCQGTVDCPTMGNAEIWWPKIASTPNYAGWINEAQYNGDGEIVGIVEKNVGNSKSNDHALRDNIKKNRLRIVLAVVEGDNCPVGYCYRFLGVFALNVNESKLKNCCVWERKEWKVAVR